MAKAGFKLRVLLPGIKLAFEGGRLLSDKQLFTHCQNW